jgi:catechol 2,3-dioxygenase-like lactoylglutathione lyase family enzyme
LGIHHVAIAVKDIDATHRFYSEAMGFRLAYVEVIEQNRGWAKHAFYETGSPRDQLIAFWDLHGIMEDEDWSADISRGLGLPRSINHLAFSAEDLSSSRYSPGSSPRRTPGPPRNACATRIQSPRP